MKLITYSTGDFLAWGSDAPFFEEVRLKRLRDEAVVASATAIVNEAAKTVVVYALGPPPIYDEDSLIMSEAKLDARVEDAEIAEEARVLLSERLAEIAQEGRPLPTQHCQQTWLNQFSLTILNERLSLGVR